MLSDYFFGVILFSPFIWILPATLFVTGVYLLARNRKPKYNRRMAKYY
jgi:hypothetical protein